MSLEAGGEPVLQAGQLQKLGPFMAKTLAQAKVWGSSPLQINDDSFGSPKCSRDLLVSPAATSHHREEGWD